ncbi:hypothetical protein [Polyangium aurulentum]|uniref:hypothetical protein n=1 Tax=Polyangium aurulentum TaxID=2567896 RepID=UPI0010AED805|nr:hypothetical protein [Polyangium aurulentum]UQA57835.1 hypothetical protein E8A73_042255 [Polyangium aurulentum]
MEAHRVEATIQPGGTLTVEGLPLGEGTSVEVIVLVKEKPQRSAYPLQGTPYQFEDPFSPAEAEGWEAER